MNKCLRATLIIIFSIFPITLFAQNSSEVVIVNHYNKPLVFTPTINPEILPGLPLTINEGDSVTTSILDLNKEVYVNVDDHNSNYAFFGMQLINNQINFYGYLSSGIAYSWHENTITFCQHYAIKTGQCA